MKRAAFEHPKLARLKNTLGLRRYQAIGLLEALWHFTALYAPGGDIGKWSNAEIAEGIDWDKEPSLLIESLVKCAWLDAHRRARLVVHDWHAHADDAVHMHLARARRWFTDGQVPKLTRLPKDDRDSAQAFYDTHPCARNTHGKRTRNTSNLVALPSPPLPCLSPPMPCMEESAPSRAEDGPLDAGLECPLELVGLELYQADVKLCKKLPPVLDGWRLAFPGVDLSSEIRKAHAWELANPSRRKKDRIRFLNGWLSRAQDAPRKEQDHGRAGTSGGNPPAGVAGFSQHEPGKFAGR